MLVDLVRREGLTDPDLERMRGVGRHIWTQNTINHRTVLAALDALAAADIRPMLLKGAALFARSPEYMSKRASSDGDILVRPEELQRAAQALRRGGFALLNHHWDDLDVPLIDSDTAGVPMQFGSHQGGLDLHWRPLWNIRDEGLISAIFGRADEHEMNGRPVYLPTVTDHLFLAIARCEPWDLDESFVRLVEGHLLLSANRDAVSWEALLQHAMRYGVEVGAFGFLNDLNRCAGLQMPESTLSELARRVTAAKLAEWGIRQIPPERRSVHQRWILQRSDILHQRSEPALEPSSWPDVQLMRLGLNAGTAGLLWRALRRRVHHEPITDIKFLEGFSYPEANGRWSSGRWAAIAVPLTEEQQAGAPFRLNCHAYFGRSDRARIVGYGGRGIIDFTQLQSAPDNTLALGVRPLPQLGGAGLILLWLPNAQTPLDANESNDRRELGLFIRRDWQSARSNRQAARPTIYRRMRGLYRGLPLPLAFRERVSPLMQKLVTVVAKRSVPAPLKVDSIQPGDIVLSAFLSDVSGIGRAGRMTRDSLNTWGVPLTEHDIRMDPSADDVPDVGSGGLWICHCNAPEATAVMMAGTERLWARRYRIGVWAYELQRLPADWEGVLAHFHEIWVPSQFVADAVLRSRRFDVPIVKIVPHPVTVPQPEMARSNHPNQPFTFLSMFDIRSTSARKNPMGAIRAFQSAFQPDSPDAKLVLKVVHSEADTDALNELREAVADCSNISLVTEHLSDSEAIALIASADCLVSLHRSEGFGLTVAEAMSVGTPSIITGWSAPVEFSKGAAVEIDFHLVPVNDRSKRYEGLGEVWAEPDIDHASRVMRRLVDDPVQWSALSRAGIEIARKTLSRPIATTDYRRFLMPRRDSAHAVHGIDSQ